MYQKILVPLDGSALAECVLPHVEFVAKGCNAPNVVFMRVVEPAPLLLGNFTDYVESFTDAEAEQTQKRMDSARRATAQEYLNELLTRTSYDGAKLESEVISGKAADSIAEYAEKNDIDLIIVATHGRSGMSRWVLGSVADRVLRSSCVPVLMVRAPGCIIGF
ncbi:universal stress protein [Chloroflexota bacterium]